MLEIDSQARAWESVESELAGWGISDVWALTVQTVAGLSKLNPRYLADTDFKHSP